MKTDIDTRKDIDLLMRAFYARAMADDVIGYIFTDVIKLDLDHHLPIIGDFWETIIFQTGVYARHGRNPLEVHAALNEKERLLPGHLDRWLAIFGETLDEMFAGERVEFMKLRAVAIGERILQYVGGPVRVQRS